MITSVQAQESTVEFSGSAGPSAPGVVLGESSESLLDALLMAAVAKAEAERAQEQEWPVVGSKGRARGSAPAAVPTSNRFLALGKPK